MARSLHADLTTAQQAASGTPYIRINLPDYGGGTDLTAYLVGLDHIEQSFGGSATLLLTDAASWFIVTSKPIELKGQQVNIGYGFNCAGDVDRYSECAPLWIRNTRLISRAGALYVQLECYDIWQKLQMLRVIGGGTRLTGTITGTFEVSETVTGGTSNETATIISINSDENYIRVGGASGAFTVGETISGGDSGASMVLDTTITEGASAGPRYPGDTTILDIIKGLLAGITTVTVDTNDGVIDVYKPWIETDINTPIINIISDLINMSNSGMRMRQDGMHILKLPEISTGCYTYGSSQSHAYFSCMSDDELTWPNRIIVVNQYPTNTETQIYEGSAIDTNSYTALGFYVTRVYFEENIASDAEATALAEAYLSAAQRSASRGVAVVPHNCGQELFDYITVSDYRW